MSELCHVRAKIRSLADGSIVERELGEFHEVWKDGISIGSDPRCAIVLQSPDVAPVAARLIGGGNHRMLRLLPPGTSLPLPPDTYPFRRDDRRVDYGFFRVGPFEIAVEEDGE